MASYQINFPLEVFNNLQYRETIFSCWTPNVTKFTAGSFYNFEQDNEPLYDLEERTYFNWQKLGWPSYPRKDLHFLVSATAPQNEINCNSNIFTTVQEAINALPRFITGQVRISIASFGNLGQIDLDGIHIDPTEGFLEIVNLNAFDPAGTFAGDSTSATYHYDARLTGIADTQNAPAAAGLYKNFVSVSNDDIGGSGTGGLAQFFLRPDDGEYGYRPRVSRFDTLPYVFSAVDGELDQRVNGNYYAFLAPPAGYGKLGATPSQVSRLSFGPLNISNVLKDGDNYSLTGSVLLPEEEVPGQILPLKYFNDIKDYDPSSFLQTYTPGTATIRTAQNSLYTQSSDPTKQEGVVKATVYGNYCSRLKVTNCQGQIAIRNLLCKNTTFKVGMQIEDCNNLTLESCAAVDYGIGIHLTSSKVFINRSFYLYRCYEKSEQDYLYPSGRRLSGLWQDNIKNLEGPDRDRSGGLVAFNSEIVFGDAVSNPNSNELTRYEFTLSLYDPDYIENPRFLPGKQNLKIISRCSTGIRLVNSILRGGHGPFYKEHATSRDTLRSDYLHLEGNANYGLDSLNSNIQLTLSLEVFHNTRGIRARDTSLSLENFKIDNNHLYGINLVNSKFTYGVVEVSSLPVNRFDYETQSIKYDVSNLKKYQFVLNTNGQNIIAKNSVICPVSMPDPLYDYLGKFYSVYAHGANTASNPLPSIDLEQTDATFLHLNSYRVGIQGQAMLGAHIAAKNNSSVTLLGSENALTILEANPVNTLGQVDKYVGVYLDNNSIASFRGPTVIYDGAINVYATRNSTMKFEPHKNSGGSLDINGFNLSNPANHTMVELKSTKICLLADSGSNIVMEDLGAYTETWSEENVLATTYKNHLTEYNKDSYVSAGFIQFYPNPNADVYGNTPYSDVLDRRGSLPVMQNNNGRYHWGFDYTTNDPFEFSSITHGGVCVKATNNSNVRVRNVNFPCGWWNASSVIYDLNDPKGEGYCGKLFIWNLSNNSSLHADFLSVSSLYPASAGYYGPQSVWPSATQQEGYYTLPSGTPDTSTLAVLDYFGVYPEPLLWKLPNGTSADYGFDSPQNQGPFRLYVGVDSLANQFSQQGVYGGVAQTFAQGYHVSGNLSSLEIARANYGKILRRTDGGGLAASGYYYSDEFVKCDPNMIMLDESAANTFANAKNGAMGGSRRPQICTIYYATTDDIGEGKAYSLDQAGAGFKSPNIFDILQDL